MLTLVVVSRLPAQDSTAITWRNEWRPRHDALALAGVSLAALAVAPHDVRWARAIRGDRYQHSTALHNTAGALRTLGDPGAVIISAGLWGTGWALHRPGLGDAGRHASEAVVVSGLLTSGLKMVFGRSRPFVVHDSDNARFDWFEGTERGNASMPSGHTTVAFAMAAALGDELARTHPRAGRIVRPLLYLGASGVGVSRMYHDSHWASDVVVGAGLGTIVARRLVAMAHPRR